MNAERWRRITRVPLMVASGLFLLTYSWQVIGDLDGTREIIARGFMAVTWVFFAVDYGVRLWLASPRGAWFRQHIFDLLVVALPALRPLRLLRALTAVSVLQRTAGTELRGRIAIYGTGAAMLLIWIAALGVLDAERDVAGANIHTFGNAVWWAFVAVTTVGYGDVYPVTLGGRTIAVLLMAGGVALVGIVTATLASWVFETVVARARPEGDDPATRDQIEVLSRQVAELSARLGEPGGTVPRP